jgi:TRAP-type C4-dicarboxylate transport system substrate-binding protein
MQTISRVIASAAALALWSLAASGPADAQSVVLRLGHVDGPTTHSGVGAEAFAAEVAKLSNGDMKVEVLHSGKLGNIGEEIKNTMVGAQDLHLLYPEFLTNLVDESKILSAPYLFRDLPHLQAYMKSDLFKPALQKIQASGAIILDPEWTWWIKDPRGVIAVRPIKTPADLNGLKLRIWESKTAIATWKGLGANTIVVPRPEMYLALKQGIVEGGPETIGIAYEQKSAEVVKFWTRTDEYYQIINIMMNERKYNSLTPAQRNILHQAAANAAKAFTAESERGYQEKKAKAVAEYGVTILEPDLTPWRDKAKPVLADLEAEGVIPKGLAEKAAALK